MVYKTKICNKCKTKYIPTNGRQLFCIECKNISDLDRRKKWILLNKEHSLIYQREYRKKHIEKFRERDRLLKKKKRKDNPLLEKEIQKKWRIKNVEKHRLNNKIWRENNKKYIVFMNIQRRIKLKNIIGKHSYKEWKDLIKKYNFTCPCCNRKEPIIKLTEDHIIPLSKGGNNNITNIQPLCGQCNSMKYTKTIKYANTL